MGIFEVPYTTYLPFCTLGNYTVQLPMLIFGTQARSIQSAMGSDSPIARLIPVIAVVVSIIALTCLSRYMKTILDTNVDDNDVEDISLDTVEQCSHTLSFGDESSGNTSS